MPKTVTMTFRRADAEGRACLEYSWVPEGKRHNVVLNPGVHDYTQTDQVPDDVKPSHVQVYVLTNMQESTLMWQFPLGPPRPQEVQHALVDAKAPLTAIGTVRYAGGGTASDTRELDPIERDCPTSL